MGRLIGSAMSMNGSSLGKAWSERGISYDLDGNLLSLERYQASGTAPADRLNFSYVDGHRTEWEYDANGNVTYDPLRNFEISYDLLNLPGEVMVGPDPEDNEDGYEEGSVISGYIYYADGTLKGIYDGEDGYYSSRYIGSLIYDGEPGEESLSGVLVSDGYIDCSTGVSNARAQFFLKDHLGSVRVVAEDSGTVISRIDYLPFGVRMTGNGLPQSSGRSRLYGYSGKENAPFGTVEPRNGNWTLGERYQNFGARTYDPVTCTVLQVDPLAENYHSITPYAYCAGDPVNLADPDGRFPDIIWDVANVTMDVSSLVSNIKDGNWGGTVVDALGLTADVFAAAIPLLPAGAGTAIKPVRAGNKAIDAVQATDHAVDAGKAAQKSLTITENAAKGKAFEGIVSTKFGGYKASQVTIEVQDRW